MAATEGGQKCPAQYAFAFCISLMCALSRRIPVSYLEMKLVNATWSFLNLKKHKTENQFLLYVTNHIILKVTFSIRNVMGKEFPSLRKKKFVAYLFCWMQIYLCIISINSNTMCIKWKYYQRTLIYIIHTYIFFSLTCCLTQADYVFQPKSFSNVEGQNWRMLINNMVRTSPATTSFAAMRDVMFWQIFRVRTCFLLCCENHSSHVLKRNWFSQLNLQSVHPLA